MSNLSETQIQEIKFLDELLDQIIILDKSKNICCANKSAHKRFGSKLEGKNISSILRDAKLLGGLKSFLFQNIKLSKQNTFF